MSDIVKRLRPQMPYDDDAAAEIERLLAALSKARWHLKRYDQPSAMIAIEAAIATKTGGC